MTWELDGISQTVPRGQHWKVAVIIGAISLGVTALLFTRAGSPTPRPWFVFVGIAATVACLLTAIIGTTSQLTFAIGGYVALLTGFFVRASTFVRVISSGVDHGRWLSYAVEYMQLGQLATRDMYAASPLYILELVVGNGVLGGSIYSTRFFTIAVASLLPLFVALLSYRISRDVRVGYVAMLLTVTGPLFVRTAVLLEAESLAISWFVLGTYFFARCLRTQDRRYYALFLAIAGTAVMLHFFYGLILFMTVAGSMVLGHILRSLGVIELPDVRPTFRLDICILAVGVITSAWIVWSVYAHTAAATLQSGTSITIPANPLDLFLPSSDTVGESTGGGDGGGPFDLLSRLYPVFSLLVMALIGAVYSTINPLRHRLGVLIASVVATMSIVAAIVGLDYDLGFRMYYFLSIFLIFFAAITIATGTRIERSAARPVVIFVLVVFVFSYALIAPVTPIGNNVDPRFGGTVWKVTDSEHRELEHLDARFEGETPVESELSQVHSFLLPRISNDRLYISATDCRQATVSDTGSFSICTGDARPVESITLRPPTGATFTLVGIPRSLLVNV